MLCTQHRPVTTDANNSCSLNCGLFNSPVLPAPAKVLVYSFLRKSTTQGRKISCWLVSHYKFLLTNSMWTVLHCDKGCMDEWNIDGNTYFSSYLHNLVNYSKGNWNLNCYSSVLENTICWKSPRRVSALPFQWRHGAIMSRGVQFVLLIGWLSNEHYDHASVSTRSL